MVQLESYLLEAVPQVVQMLREGSSQDDDIIIQVHEAALPMRSSQGTVHESLKCGRGIAQTKWHHVKLEECLRGANCCLLSVLRLHFHLLVTTEQVTGGGEDTVQDPVSLSKVSSIQEKG